MDRLWGDVIGSTITNMAGQANMYGVEVELEATSVSTAPTGWLAKIDHSLKLNGSFEYVMHRPLLEEETVEALSVLHTHLITRGGFTNGLPVQSDRGGIHVHCNMCHTNYDRLLTTIITFLLCEKAVFDMLPPSRERSIFCCPIYKSWKQQQLVISLASYIRHMLESDKPINYQDGFWKTHGPWFSTSKNYWSINFGALFHFGSIEMRAFPTSHDLTEWFNYFFLTSTLHMAATHYSFKDLTDPTTAKNLILNAVRSELEGDSAFLDDTIYESIRTAWPYTQRLIKQQFISPLRDFRKTRLMPASPAVALNVFESIAPAFAKRTA